jgi:hypothetical protein
MLPKDADNKTGVDPFTRNLSALNLIFFGISLTLWE